MKNWIIAVLNFLMFSSAFSSVHADTRIVVGDPASQTVEALMTSGFSVIGRLGDSPIVMIKEGQKLEKTLCEFILSDEENLAVLSPIYSHSVLPSEFRSFVVCAHDGILLIKVPISLDLGRFAANGFEVRAIPLRAIRSPRPVRMPKLDRTVQPLVQTMTDQVDLVNYQTLLDELVNFGDRYSCSPGHGATAATYLYNKFASYGFTNISYQSFDSCSDNVIARKTGSLNPDRIWVIGAHYDSYASSNAPGADDNGSGTGAVLEIARVLNQYEFEDTIDFVLFASEERGLYGSEAYAAAADSANTNIVGMINLDMIGYEASGYPADLDVVANASSMWLETIAFQVIDDYLTGTPRKDNELPSGAGSDHESFNDHGFSAIMFFEDEPHYSPYIHSANDTIPLSLNSWPFAMKFTKAALATLALCAVPRDIYLTGYDVDDSSGDQDGLPDPGEQIGLAITIQNRIGSTITNVNASLECLTNCIGITIVQGNHLFGTMTQSQILDNSASPFQVHFDSGIADGTVVRFGVTITADGGYAEMTPIELTVTPRNESSISCWNMDSDPGWVVTGGSGNYRFQWGVPTGAGGAYGEPDPTSGYTGANVYGYNLSGDYQNGISEQSLTTGTINCIGAVDTVLDFWCWLGVEESQYDHARIYASSNNGSSWTEIWSNSSTLNAGAWEHWILDISSIADNQSQVKIKWTIGTTDTAWVFCGWNIDDVCIRGWTLPVGTATPTRSPTPTSTATPVQATNTPTRTPTVPLPTNTPTRTPTVPLPTNTPTRTPTVPLPTNTPTRTPTRTPTPVPATLTPTRTPTSTSTVTPMAATHTPTRTPTVPTATSTATRTPTRTPTSTFPPSTHTPTPTVAPTITPTPTPQPIPTMTPGGTTLLLTLFALLILLNSRRKLPLGPRHLDH